MIDLSHCPDHDGRCSPVMLGDTPAGRRSLGIVVLHPASKNALTVTRLREWLELAERGEIVSTMVIAEHHDRRFSIEATPPSMPVQDQVVQLALLLGQHLSNWWTE